MPTDIQLTGGYSPLQISGKEFNARTLSEKDHSELSEFVQLELIKLARKSLTDDMSFEERNEFIQSAIQGAAGVKWSSQTGWRIMTTLEGFFRLGWQMVRHGHPSLSYEEFKRIASYEGNGVANKNELIQENIDHIDQTFMRLNTSFTKALEEDQEASSEEPKSNS